MNSKPAKEKNKKKHIIGNVKNAQKKKDAKKESMKISGIEKARKEKFSKEGLAKIYASESTFFNERMRQCRDLTSLWVGTLPQIDLGVDAFCASGARGIRYLLENKNIEKVHFIDRSKNALKSLRENLKANKISKKKYEIFEWDVNRYFYDNPSFACKEGGMKTFSFAEIDPFGTPMPYLDSLFSCVGGEREKYISITATDMAVLCGAQKKACIKNYSTQPINNEFCHEAALRILLGKIASVAASYNWALEPQFCFSHFHYLKILAKVKQGADAAAESAKLAKGYIEYCPFCMHHNLSTNFPREKCPQCGKSMQWAGPLWAGKWCEREKLEEMNKLLAKRNYLDKHSLAQFLQIISGEIGGPSLYYDVHKIAKKYFVNLPKSEDLINSLKREGYFASRTHFKNTGIRTDAPVKKIAEKMGKKK
ncbi:hypothetical protein COU37_04105 [Candidatus Micrarchaeota archaeon CG10_big_fil_rev_8_21_14_0_10_45_29]|nr:MAG: hypothetical protein COU37_04105 [Candidatus Micrarchaeota archaeon CG10_big_fil_rev_8_21_14_0_10_45_29]